MRKTLLLLALSGFAAIAHAQEGEISVSGGVSRFGDAKIGDPTDLASMNGGFRLGFRITFNPQRFFGHEVGYAYSRTGVKIAGEDTSVPNHAGFYDFLVYLTPKDTKIRPFVCGGAGFSSFFPPGSSVYYGNQETHFALNYGGGVKARVSSLLGIRFDVRDYNSGKPLSNYFNNSGRLNQWEFSAGVGLFF